MEIGTDAQRHWYCVAESEGGGWGPGGGDGGEEVTLHFVKIRKRVRPFTKKSSVYITNRKSYRYTLIWGY